MLVFFLPLAVHIEFHKCLNKLSLQARCIEMNSFYSMAVWSKMLVLRATRSWSFNPTVYFSPVFHFPLTPQLRISQWYVLNVMFFQLYNLGYWWFRQGVKCVFQRTCLCYSLMKWFWNTIYRFKSTPYLFMALFRSLPFQVFVQTRNIRTNSGCVWLCWRTVTKEHGA